MSESKHTPGPWFVEEPLHRFIRSLAGKSPFVAELNILDKTHGEHMANARLIASAPDLLAACEAAQVAFAAEFDATHIQGIAVREAVKMLRESIASARGERAR